MMFIKIKNANTHNLKNVSVDIPIGKISCFSGPSGSGKSSLVFQTLANESKRRFLNSLPSDVTFFDKVPQSADVESIMPVLPVWVLAQNNPIVGSRLNLLDQLELSMGMAQLFYEQSSDKCLIHHKKFSDSEDNLMRLLEDLASEDDVIHFFIDRSIYKDELSGAPVRSFDYNESRLNNYCESDQYYEIFRVKAKSLSRVNKKMSEFAFLKSGESSILIYFTSSQKTEFYRYTKQRVCDECLEEDVSSARSVNELLPFNGVGACQKCKGYGSTLEYSRSILVKYPHLSVSEGAVTILGYSKFTHYQKSYEAELKKKRISLVKPFDELSDEAYEILMEGRGSFPGVNTLLSYLEEKRYKRSVRIFLRSIQVEKTCDACFGTRVGQSALRHYSVELKKSYVDLLQMTIEDCLKYLNSIKVRDNQHILKNVIVKLQVATELGLGPLYLNDKLKALETSDYQKSLLVRYFSYEGSGSLFVLDEPSLGLNLDEQKVLVKYLKKLTPNNTVVIVDHSEYLQRNSEQNFIIGPGAGHLGGEVVYSGKYKKKKTKEIKIAKSIKDSKSYIEFKKVLVDNLSFKSVKIPRGSISVVKNIRDNIAKKLINDGIANYLNYEIFGEKLNYDANYSIKSVKGLTEFEDIVLYTMDVGRSSSRSSVGTMLGLTPEVRKYFSNLPVSKNLGLEKGHFSPNSDLGKCRVCDGKGIVEIDMQFLEDVRLECEECQGKKLAPFYANITDGNFSVYEAYNTPISKLFDHIPKTPKVNRILEYLKLLKLDYLTLDRSLPSLSGGERLRIKFLNSLQKNIENSLLIFSNLSYGLSEVELVKIREFLEELVQKSNTVILLDNHPIFDDFQELVVKAE